MMNSGKMPMAMKPSNKMKKEKMMMEKRDMMMKSSDMTNMMNPKGLPGYKKKRVKSF